jgi:hypothetical protein
LYFEGTLDSEIVTEGEEGMLNLSYNSLTAGGALTRTDITLICFDGETSISATNSVYVNYLNLK